MHSWAPKHDIPYSVYARSKSMATFAQEGRDVCPYHYMVYGSVGMSADTVL
jgi:hypothetical protein